MTIKNLRKTTLNSGHEIELLSFSHKVIGKNSVNVGYQIWENDSENASFITSNLGLAKQRYDSILAMFKNIEKNIKAKEIYKIKKEMRTNNTPQEWTNKLQRLHDFITQPNKVGYKNEINLEAIIKLLLDINFNETHINKYLLADIRLAIKKADI